MGAVLAFLDDQWPEIEEEPWVADPFELMKAIDRRRQEKISAQCRQLHFQEPKNIKPSTRLKHPLFSRRLEGGRAQRHRQKWKLKRQKARNA